jgi:NAD(P)-dependent dehydrogenase (short-subunit alcohol dehydrogenase family)
MADVSKAVLITGCSTGIGRATAQRLIGGTRPVVATARRTETLTELEAAGAEVLPLDVTDEDSMRAAVDTVVERHGAVGVLVNNAGYSQSGAIETLPMAALRRQFETNVFGLVRMCQLVLPGMRAQRWGRIVNLSSMGANFTFPGGGAYHATKYAVEAVSDALRFEVKGFGVGVTVIQPGLIRSEFATTAAGETPVENGPYGGFNAAVISATLAAYTRGPLARLGGTPEDVAAAVEAAIEAKRPPIRVRVTPSARVLIAQKRLLPDALWDRLMATQFPRPSAS